MRSYDTMTVKGLEKEIENTDKQIKQALDTLQALRADKKQMIDALPLAKNNEEVRALKAKRNKAQSAELKELLDFKIEILQPKQKKPVKHTRGSSIKCELVAGDKVTIKKVNKDGRHTVEYNKGGDTIHGRLSSGHHVDIDTGVVIDNCKIYK